MDDEMQWPSLCHTWLHLHKDQQQTTIDLQDLQMLIDSLDIDQQTTPLAVALNLIVHGQDPLVAFSMVLKPSAEQFSSHPEIEVDAAIENRWQSCQTTNKKH